MQVMASRRGVSLMRRWVCPRCGSKTLTPLVGKTGWCKACTLEQGVYKAHQANQAVRRELDIERRRIAEAERRRQALYKDTNKQKKKLCRLRGGEK